MAPDSDSERPGFVPADEETLGLYLSFYDAAVLRIALTTVLKANLIPFDRIPTVHRIRDEAGKIAQELTPKPKFKIILPDGPYPDNKSQP